MSLSDSAYGDGLTYLQCLVGLPWSGEVETIIDVKWRSEDP